MGIVGCEYCHVNVLHSKDAINSNEIVLVMEVCIVRIILEKVA